MSDHVTHQSNVLPQDPTENPSNDGGEKNEGAEKYEFKVTVRKLEMAARPRGVLAE